MTCCGRPNNRAQKGSGGEAGYYARYAYLNSSQRAKEKALVGSKCKECAALTMGDPCSVCGNPKEPSEQDKSE